MSRTGGEGRAPNEKAGRLVVPAEVRKAQREKRAKEEQDWADKAGPVQTSRKEPS